LHSNFETASYFENSYLDPKLLLTQLSMKSIIKQVTIDINTKTKSSTKEINTRILVTKWNLLKNSSKVKPFQRTANPKDVHYRILVLQIDLTYETFVTPKTRFVTLANDLFTSHRSGFGTCDLILQGSPSSTNHVRYNFKLWWLKVFLWFGWWKTKRGIKYV
jgi:hypothetical protein